MGPWIIHVLRSGGLDTFGFDQSLTTGMIPYLELAVIQDAICKVLGHSFSYNFVVSIHITESSLLNQEGKSPVRILLLQFKAAWK